MKRLAIPLLLLLLAGCQQGSNTPLPVPSVAQIGADLNCPGGDHGFEDAGAGWGFCYPASWKYTEPRAQGSVNPTRLDLVFNITDVNTGLFALMIVSTIERGSSTDLVTWMQANLSSLSVTSLPDRQAIVWGNAGEADRLSDGRRIALTPTHVVILELRSGQGLLDLESAMSTRLDTWKFLV
jgi:hypothetical protein